MKRSCIVLGMVMGIGLVAAACGQAPEAEIDIGGPGLEQMDKPGGQDTNGTPKIAWHTWKDQVAAALGQPLLQNGEINPQIDAGLFSPGYGPEIFRHAFRCAIPCPELPPGCLTEEQCPDYCDYDLGEGVGVYRGLGLVNGASVWLSQGLPEQVRNNVLECVVAYVNDAGQGIEILLTGDNVIDDGKDHSKFIIGEAVWCADIVPSPSTPTMREVRVTVYPTEAFDDRCDAIAWEALKWRSCYDPSNCGLDYGGILEESPLKCQDVGPLGYGIYECNGKPCTMTWLEDKTPDWCTPPM